MEFTISNEAKTILSVLYNNGDFSAANYSDESFSLLKSYGLIQHDILCHEASRDGAFRVLTPIYETSITEKGKAYYEELLRVEDERAFNREAILKRLQIAEEELEETKKESKSSSIRSWIAIIISLAALALQLFSALST